MDARRFEGEKVSPLGKGNYETAAQEFGISRMTSLGQ